ncbi:MAG: 16S rRNA (uracil(1498)-N(3))-methyltransferase [Flavobacteriales bacterium]|nr:16S rRNA (uracil(1498)-N(3))-methyltransferase [Flavobacteriales bacterium]
MQLFYSESILNHQLLDNNESFHCISVLRKKINDIINVTDGKGNLYECKIENIIDKKIKLKIINTKNSSLKKKIKLAVSFPKNRNRIEWMLEKLTEIGVHEIYPIICTNSERNKVNANRCEKILISSMKQSLNLFKPILNKILTFNEFINSIKCEEKYIAHCNDNFKRKLIERSKKNEICILIGPEGDFTNEEIKLSEEMNFKSVSLSNNRLRTETAAIISCNNIL